MIVSYNKFIFLVFVLARNFLIQRLSKYNIQTAQEHESWHAYFYAALISKYYFVVVFYVWLLLCRITYSRSEVESGESTYFFFLKFLVGWDRKKEYNLESRIFSNESDFGTENMQWQLQKRLFLDQCFAIYLFSERFKKTEKKRYKIRLLKCHSQG